ncbi:FecR family protein [Rhizobiaceae bacterium n13]|uniref:FecR family protein n=1 Tax=Ferirhizobium litorale TaxID=2927786 RepID=A0AAE3U0W1_9HYPH|nr:FecR family protein [Fererhizobium litorale]MDI7862232.1 FecR family protein [Fererhizobium litorale]MDI7922494.1 FecR family protein [Fererhizobium litorale]
MLFAAPWLGSARAATALGRAVNARGSVERRRDKAVERLAVGAPLIERDAVVTGRKSYAELRLGAATRVFLGGETELVIDRFVAEQGGTLELGAGRMVFDRPEGESKVDMELRTAFGMIGVRGTKFFCGPSRGAFAVFVEHGEVVVSNAGVVQTVRPGQGVDVASPNAPPTDPAEWGQARIEEAYASVGL